MSANLKEHAQSNGYWKPEDGEFDFAKAYSGAIPSGEYRLQCIGVLLWP